jgi:hypothetical protein
MRKLKLVIIAVCTISDVNEIRELLVLWAFVYVPEGMQPRKLNAATNPIPQNPISMYEPN